MILLHSSAWMRMMPAMGHIYDPAALRHPNLRECAYHAAWIAAVTAAANDVEDLLVDVPPQERAPGPERDVAGGGSSETLIDRLRRLIGR